MDEGEILPYAYYGYTATQENVLSAYNLDTLRYIGQLEAQLSAAEGRLVQVPSKKETQ